MAKMASFRELMREPLEATAASVCRYCIKPIERRGSLWYEIGKGAGADLCLKVPSGEHAPVGREPKGSRRSRMTKTTSAAPKDEIIARRKTYDDKAIALWSDGSLTWGGIGRTIEGSPNAKTPAAREAALKAGWLVLGEVEVYDAEDVPRLIKAARKVAAKNGLPGDLRREFWKDVPLRPHWETYQTDRDGKPTIRTWRLPRMSHPGLVVWDRVTGAKRYEVMHTLSGRGSSTLATTGVRFDTLPELAKYLRETSALAGYGKKG